MLNRKKTFAFSSAVQPSRRSFKSIQTNNSTQISVNKIEFSQFKNYLRYPRKKVLEFKNGFKEYKYR